MKISFDYSTLYLELIDKAKEVVFGAEKFWSYEDKKEIAHDITVQFLYSKSFLDVYSSERGKLIPFFSSYVKKCLMGVYDKRFRNQNLSLDKFDVLDEKLTPDKLYEYKDLLFKMRNRVSQIYPNKKDGIFYESLLDSILQNGKMNFSFVGKKCGVSKTAARAKSLRIFDRLKREFLNGRSE